jgi:hypothetical protein
MFARVALLSLLAVSIAAASDAPDFSGVWAETQPGNGRPLRLQLTQSGSQVQVRISYGDAFPNKLLATATLQNGTAVWTLPQSCIARFRWAGYNYDHPGASTFTLSLQAGESGPQLVYVEETRWNAPCANNHPVGTERIQKILKRQ